MARLLKPAHTWDASPLAWCVLLILSIPHLFADLRGRGFTDNEGMYAEIGRQMLRTGDWVTPHLNGAPYLNKPPLVFWLTALLESLTGLNEIVRLLSGLAFLLTAVLLIDFARRLWPDRPGAPFWSAAAFLTFAQTPVEARFLRPDPFLVLFVTLSCWGAARIALAAERECRIGTAALWGGIGLAVMSKGLVGFVLPILAVVPALALAGEARSWRGYCSGWGVLLVLALVLPWHVAVGLRNPGFWWDYVVNQHLLFFFDRKFPHDSVPDSLLLTWSTFAGRLLPWLFFVPAALALQFRSVRETRSAATWLPLTWAGAIGFFFSLNRSRQLHYLMPAIPAVALLLGALCDEWTSTAVTSRRRWVPFTILAAAMSLLPLLMAEIFRRVELQSLAPGLPGLAQRALLALAAGCVIALVLAAGRRWVAALVAVGTAGLAFNVLAVGAMDLSGSFSSVRELVAAAPKPLPNGTEVVYEAGEEYQLCGSLNFYLRRDQIELQEPPGFIPPTYLARDVTRLFTPRADIRRQWASGGRRMLLFTNPDLPLDRPSDFPRPFFELSRGGRRLMLTNAPCSRVISTRTPTESPAAWR